MGKRPWKIRAVGFFLALASGVAAMDMPGRMAVYNVKDFGASGRRGDAARSALQQAIDSCAAAGGGIVYLPPGEYTSGTLHLRSRVRLFLEAGATLYSSKNKTDFDQDALLFGQDVEQVSIEGRGTINGLGAYEYRPKGDFHDDFIYPNQVEMEKLGKPLIRSFPKTDQFGKLVLLLRCKDVRITGVSFINSPSWTIHPYGCERLVIDGVYIRSSLKDGVWADGIDPDGCQDVRISNSTIETGDDALVFYSMNWFGPALPCENITVTNCRLSSASSAIKFCDGNMNAIRNVTISNCVITNSNRGIAVMNFDGGVVENVVLSNLTIDCVRYDWFWWGDGEPFHFNVKKRSEVHKNWKKEDDRPAGTIRNIVIKDVIAHGQGASVCNGHPDNWLDGVTMENIKLFIAHNPAYPYDKAVHALTFKWAQHLSLRNVEIIWDKPESEQWRSALLLENVRGLVLEGLRARQALIGSTAPAVLFNRVEDAVMSHCCAQVGTGIFLYILGPDARHILLHGNDFTRAQVPYRLDAHVQRKEVRED